MNDCTLTDIDIILRALYESRSRNVETLNKMLLEDDIDSSYLTDYIDDQEITIRKILKELRDGGK